MRSAPRISRLLFLLVPAAVLLAAGCIPVGWLPDSSGFLYLNGEKPEIVHYDVATGKKHILAEVPANTLSPAVSPDGKRFAVARIVSRGEGKPADIQVLVYDLKGKEVHKSPLVLWREEHKEDKAPTSVYWSRSRDKLIVHDYADKPRTGLYDLQTRKFNFVEGMPCAFGGTPLRPDDKGFLLRPLGEGKGPLSLVDWEGKAEEVRLDEALSGEDWKDPLLSPWLGTSTWEKNVAVVIHKDGLARIDTDKRTGVAAKAPADPLAAGLDPVLQRHDFPGKGARARVVERTADGAKFHHLLVWKPGEKKPEEVFKVKKGFLVLSPSPDGKWLAVRAMGDDLEGFEVLLLSKDGEVKIVRAKE